MAKTPKSTYTPRDLGAALNNAVAMSKASATDIMPELRMRRLSAYALALIAPVREDTAAGLLIAEEAVFVLASAALLLHAMEVQKTDKLPFLQDAKDALTDTEKELESKG